MIKVLYIFFSIFLLAACGLSPEEIALQTHSAATATVARWTKTPTPTHTPTVDSDDTSDKINRSKYFEQVELLESTNIPLKTGDEAYLVRSSAIRDMDADGVADAILVLTTYPVNIPHPIVVLNGDGPVNNISRHIFPGGIPSIRHSNQIFFVDIDNDNREDLLISEAGLDHPPWHSPDALIGIAMNLGGGIFEDVSATVPEEAKGLTNYSLAAGDLYNDGIVRIILPSQATSEDYEGPKMTGLLFWNGSEFEFQQNWVDVYLWWWREDLKSSSFMSVSSCLPVDVRQSSFTSFWRVRWACWFATTGIMRWG